MLKHIKKALQEKVAADAGADPSKNLSNGLPQ
jgi:hypothetical protein